jgi:Uma2 family endonuclease
VAVPLIEYQYLVAKLVNLLSPYANKHKLGAVATAPLSVPISGNAEVFPDIVFVSTKKLIPGENKRFNGPPDLIVELASEVNTKNDLVNKREIYEKLGVKEYWLVFPEEKAMRICYLEKNKYHVQKLFSKKDDPKKSTIKSMVLRGLQFNINDVF